MLALSVSFQLGCIASPAEPWTPVERASRRGGRCLAVGFDRADEARVSPANVVVVVHVTNRCARAVPVDFSRMTVRADEVGAEPLRLFDPRAEVGPMSLLPLGDGREHLRFDAPVARAERARRVCIDVSRVSPSLRDARPVCLLSDAYGRLSIDAVEEGS